MRKSNARPNPPSMTEGELKAAAKERAARQTQLEAERKPVSERRKKWENFWYHYKFQTIGGVVLLLLAVFFIRDVFFTPKPDVTVITVVRAPIGDGDLIELEDALSAAAPDSNGDGKTLVSLNYILLPPAQDSTALPDDDAPVPSPDGADYASEVKLSTLLAAGMDLLFLVDDSTYDDLMERMGEDAGLFSPINTDGDLRLPLSSTFLDQVLPPSLAQDLSFCLRTPGSDAKSQAQHRECQDFLFSITKTPAS